MRGFC